MAKVLLSKLPQAVSEVIGNIYQGVIASRDTGIDWAKSPEKVDFQVEVVLSQNDLLREQTETSAATSRVVNEGQQVTNQVQGAAVVVVEEAGTSNEAGTSTDNSTQNSNENSNSSENSNSNENSNSSENSNSNGTQTNNTTESGTSSGTSSGSTTNYSYNWS